MAHGKVPLEQLTTRYPTYSVTSARDNWHDIREEAVARKRRVVLTRHGRPVGAIVPIEDLQRLDAIDNKVYETLLKEAEESPTEETVSAKDFFESLEENDTSEKPHHVALTAVEDDANQTKSRHDSPLPEAPAARHKLIPDDFESSTETVTEAVESIEELFEEENYEAALMQSVYLQQTIITEAFSGKKRG